MFRVVQGGIHANGSTTGFIICQGCCSSISNDVLILWQAVSPDRYIQETTTTPRTFATRLPKHLLSIAIRQRARGAGRWKVNEWERARRRRSIPPVTQCRLPKGGIIAGPLLSFRCQSLCRLPQIPSNNCVGRLFTPSLLTLPFHYRSSYTRLEYLGDPCSVLSSLNRMHTLRS